MTYTFGLDTFGDRNSDADGKPLSHAQTIRNVVEEGVFAEQAGVDFFGIGEHHTEYFPMPAGDVALAAIAARTMRIRLGSAVTVLSSDDPVRVFQRYSTLNAISGGRAEVILGRGSSIESFPLFGYDLADYEELFEEKATLFAELLKGGPVTWEGKTRPPLLNQDVVPHLDSSPFPAWIGVGGNPQSVIRAARLGFSLALAIIGGPPARFAAYSQLFQRALEKFGRPPLPVLVHSPGHVAATDEQAKAEFWPRWREIIALIAPERGFALPTEESFDTETGPHGALYVGSPETVAQKIATNLRALGATRFDLKYGMPGLTHDQLMTNIELYGRQVIPRASFASASDSASDSASTPLARTSASVHSSLMTVIETGTLAQMVLLSARISSVTSPGRSESTDRTTPEKRTRRYSYLGSLRCAAETGTGGGSASSPRADMRPSMTAGAGPPEEAMPVTSTLHPVAGRVCAGARLTRIPPVESWTKQ